MNRSIVLGLVVATSAILGVAWAQGTIKLNINGNAVTTQTRSIGGKTWVPLDDVARALKMKTFASGGQITLRPAGGAGQVANKLKGEQGEELFSGRFRFTVLNVTRAQKYERRYNGKYTSTQPIEAETGEELVIIDCRLKNGTPEKQEFAFSAGDYAENTSLTDMQEQSYQPAEFDVMADENAPLGKWALPGAAINFSIVFRVPKDTKLKDLVYSAVIYRERGNNKGTHFRVALKS